MIAVHGLHPHQYTDGLTNKEQLFIIIENIISDDVCDSYKYYTDNGSDLYMVVLSNTKPELYRSKKGNKND